MESGVVHESIVQYNRLHHNMRRCTRMGRELQTANHNHRLAEWSKRVEACRSSGQTVSQWCRENGVAISTYYLWQRRVFQAVSERAEVCFAEVPVYSTVLTVGSTAAVIHTGEVKIELCCGADTATIRAIIQAIQSC